MLSGKNNMHKINKILFKNYKNTVLFIKSKMPPIIRFLIYHQERKIKKLCQLNYNILMTINHILILKKLNVK